MKRKRMPDIIILLPGILGSALRKNGKEMWGLSANAIARGVLTLGQSIQGLELQNDDPDQEDLGDGVTADRLIPDLHLIPYLWKIDGYSRIRDQIMQVFDVTEGQNYFEFPYDWRRDNRVAAKRLARASNQWLDAWRKKSGNCDAKLILVAHSMGGLVSRHFLEVLEGWGKTRSLITFGTPYRGSLKALDFITNGFKKKVGPISLIDLSQLLRSLTSVYQLLPIYECYDPGDGRYVRVAEATAIPNLDSGKAAAALKFHRDIERAVDAHLKEQQYREGRYLTFPMVGTHQPTLQSARLTGNSVEVLRSYQEKDMDGDGTVPRVSATPIELSKDRRETFLAEQHASLQNFDAALNQLEGILTGNGLNLELIKAEEVRLGLSIEDVYDSKEPINIRVRPDRPVADLRATIVDTGESRGPVFKNLKPVDGWMETECFELKPGTYRVKVAGGPEVSPVTDIFLVQ